MNSYQSLLTHWKKYTPNSGLHPDDHIGPDQCVEFNNISEFINSDEYFQDSTRYHTKLIPVPYIGDLLNSKVYFLLLNPGFSPQDYHDETDKYFHQIQIDTLKQKIPQYPYYPLDPNLCWTSAARWSHKKLRRLILTYADKYKINYREASKQLSQQICTIELFPYHSKQFNGDKKSMSVKSTKLIREFVKERSKDKNALFFVMRQAKTWDLPEQNNIITFSAGEARGAHISEKYVNIILEYL
jgi:hypothetical protein